MTNTTKTLCLGVLVLAVAGLCPGATAQAQIVSDGFSGTNGTSIGGRTPDGANLPAATWVPYVVIAAPSVDTSTGNPVPAAATSANGAAYISITGHGSYTKPTQLSISADIRVGTIAFGSGIPRGVGLGFSTATTQSGGEASTTFTGLVARPDGSLQLLIGGSLQAATVAPFSGFSTASFYNLDFAVDTTTGSITSAFFNGNNDTATFSGATTANVFTNSVTNQAGFYGSSGASGTTGWVDNFVVSVPEPSTMALMALAVPALYGSVRRNRRLRK